HVDLGDLVQDAQSGSSRDAKPLFVVSKIDRVRVLVPVPERDAPLVDVGDQTQITLQSLPGEVFPGTVSRHAAGLEESTRTMTVEVDLPNPDSRLLPGAFGQATIVLEAEKERLLLPSEAVRYDEHGRSYVYVVDANDKIQVVDVATGLDNGQQIEITAGLNGNERLVGALLGRLKAGQLVQTE
ncbi:MAG: efflux RND transporter periplasmic adaptor subunit, partial [Planctomycetes bacterium]|nr:efflux RND transporter periplasmic adaptor subunit [Planctomycetota bacterium]